jgi:nucleoside-diphosphate-sugar epimerase
VSGFPHRIVLTGVSGTLGRNLLELIGRRPDVSILALLRPESSFPDVWPAVTAARLDLLDRQKTSARIREFEPEAIVHCAATGMLFPHVEWFDLIRFNVDLTVNLCECAAMLPRCHFIFIGTGLAYCEQVRPLNEGDPLETLHPYGASKAAADLLVRSAAAEFALPLTILRPFSFTGVGDDPSRLFGTILRGAAEGVPVDLSACTQVRDHCSARDIAQGIVAAMTNCPMSGAEAAIYNLGSGRELPLRDLIEAVVDELQLPVGLRFGARGLRPFEPSYLVADVARAARGLGWRPRHNLAHAVWQLARESFPSLRVREPRETV